MLLSISGGSDLGLFEINEAAKMVSDAAHPEANIIFGAVIDDTLGDEVRVTVIAAGFDGGMPLPKKQKAAAAEPAKRSSAMSSAATTQPQMRSVDFEASDAAGGDDLDVPDFLK